MTNPNSSTCTLDLAWSAASTPCPGGVVYNVYRSTTTPVSAVAGNLVGAGLTGTSYSDTTGLVSGTTYHYLVRAAHVSDGTEDANTVERSGAPSGVLTVATLTDTFEGAASGGGFDLTGWTHAPINGSTNWAWSTTQVYDGTHSWFAQDIATVSDMVMTSPPFGVVASTTLSFYHTYRFEGTSICFDGGTLEVTTNGGSSWTVVPDADFSAGGFNGTVSSGYNNPIGGKRAWCFGTVGAMTQVTVNLGADANLVGQTVQVRWHEGNDSSTLSTGWYVDHVVIADAGTADACTTSGAAHMLTVARTGNGTVTSTPAGIACGATCAASFAHGTPVDLAATPAAGWTFTGWGGACSGTGACQVTVDDTRAVSATFRLPLTASAVAVDPAGSTAGTGDHNGVLEPGESVPVVPTWRNDGAAASASTGALSAFTGLPGADYTVADGAADYGTVAVGAAADCAGSGDCYELGVTQTAAAATHWDTTVVETLSTGETRSWTLHLGASFTDVAVNSMMYHYIETLLHSGTTGGCTATTYCPTTQLTRAQMAMFVARAMHDGVDAAVPVSGTVTGKGDYDCVTDGASLFTDVAPTSQYCRHVHYIASQGVTLGCTATTYCPTATVARSQMAMFVSRAMAGGDAAVPVAYTDATSGLAYDCSTTTPDTYFTDVPASLSYCKHVHYLWATTVITGCTATEYCPTNKVRRDQMAKFLVNGFAFTLYHP